MNIAWYFIFFLISGFCSLVYETVWLRLAMAKFGVTTPMVSIVLSVFMAGLALGSLGGGALARSAKRRGTTLPLRLYGVAELLIGIAGLLVPQLLQIGYHLTSRGGGQLAWDSSTYYLLSGVCVVAALLPWCTAMGATFPLAMAAIRNTAAKYSERSFSFLYLSNVLGAILGTLIPTFLLIEIWGFRRTLYIASTLNILLAALVFVLSFTQRTSSDSPPPSVEPAPQPRLFDFTAKGSLWLLFITGLCTMAMEVVWIREFTIYLGNVVYSFAVILAAYLAATWVGSSVYRRWIRSHDPYLSLNAFLYLGILALLPLCFADIAFPLPLEIFSSVVRTILGIGPFSALLGFLTPLLVDHFSSGDPDRAGRAYAVNITGGIIGPLLSGFFILPWFGDHGALAVISLPLLVIGCYLAVKQMPAAESPGRTGGFQALAAKRTIWAVPVLAVILTGVTKGSDAGLPNRIEFRDDTATVLAYGTGMNKRLVVNGFGMTSLTPITKYMAHLPLAFLDRRPQNGLVICFGMGTTFRSMLSWGIDTTVVELVPSVPKLFGYYHSDGPALAKSPLAHIVIDDGRRYLERSTAQYDVITMDPPPPITTPTTSLLYSAEFYEAVKKHLKPGGIFQGWLAIQDPGWDRTVTTAFAKALQESFPYIRVFPSQGGVGFHFLASLDPIPVPTASELASRMPPRAVTDFVEWGPYHTPEEMFAAVLSHEQQISRLAALVPTVPALQDDRPINEYFFLRRLTGPYP